MIPVNCAGSSTEISPHHSFLSRKKFAVFIREARLARPVTEISVLRPGMKVFRYEHSSSDNRDETF